MNGISYVMINYWRRTMSIQKYIFNTYKKDISCTLQRKSLSFLQKWPYMLVSKTFSINMEHGMSHKWSLLHFVAQKVTLMAQLKLISLIINDDNPSCTTGVKKLPFMQKCSSRFVAIKFVKENDICNVWWMLSLMFW